jgi:hypothetical protein
MLAMEPLLAAETISSFFSDWAPEYRVALVIISIGCATLTLLVLGGVIAGVWSSAKEKQIEADLKRDMLDRGMTAEEIQQVIEAKPKSGMDRWMNSWCKK